MTNSTVRLPALSPIGHYQDGRTENLLPEDLQTDCKLPSHLPESFSGLVANLETPCEPLVDTFGRVHRSMRISVTDKCNIRCRYCMPDGEVKFLPERALMTFDQIAEIVRTASGLGVQDYRLTGGEPLVRTQLDQLISLMSAIPGVRDIGLTTNGMLLASQLDALMKAGLRRVNISLDTLSEATFQQLSRRQGLHRVLEGIEAALSEPRLHVRLNALVLRDLNIQDVFELVQFARTRLVTIRFIEFMPLDAQRVWKREQIVTGQELRELLSLKFGPLVPVQHTNSSQPATDYQFEDGSRVGFVDSVTEPFCGRCDRLRLTADGKLRNCLFGQQEWDVSEIVSLPAASDAASRQFELEAVIRACIVAKARSHGGNKPTFVVPARSMHQIGG